MPSAPMATPTAAAPAGVNEVATLQLTCKGINRTSTANADLAYYVRQFLTNSPSFTNAVLDGNLTIDADTNVFFFNMKVDLKHHFKL